MTEEKSNINSDFFVSNRKKLRQKIVGDAPIIISANGLLQKSRDDDTFPFEQDSNFWYLSGLDEPDLILVIENDKEYLVVPKRNERHAVFSEQLDKDKLAAMSGIKEIVDYKEGWERISKNLKKYANLAYIRPLPTYLETYDVYTNPANSLMIQKIKSIKSTLKFTDLRKILAELRMIKTSQEIEYIKKAIGLNYEILDKIYKNFKYYENEHDIASELNNFYFKNRLKQSFHPIVAAGKNATVLHYKSNNSPIQPSSFVLIDSGVKFNNYCSDISRVFVAGPTKRQKEVWTATKEVQKYAKSILKPKVELRDYESKITAFMGEKLKELGLIKTINKDNVRTFYPHGTSHSLGIDVHDPADYIVPLRPGMVLTVEPGIYIPDENLGVRIEDNVLITKDGIEELSAGLPSLIDSLE